MQMIDVIRKIPSDTKKSIQRYEQVDTNIHKTIKDDFDEIVIVGSGSSYNAAFLTQEFGEKVVLKPIRLYYPNVFNYHVDINLFSRKTLFVFISQSGYTSLVDEAMMKVKEQGFQTISLTENEQSPIAKKADVHIDIMTGGEPYIFRTQGFTLTALGLHLLYLSLAKKKSLRHLEGLAERIEEKIEKAEKDYRKNRDLYAEAESFIFAGAGVYWPVVQEANIKFMEMLPELTASFELEEMIHGPQNSFKNTYHYFILAEKEEDLIRAGQIQRFIEKEVGGRVELLEVHAEDDLEAIVMVSYFQVLAYYIATDRKRDLKEATYPKISQYVSRKKND